MIPPAAPDALAGTPYRALRPLRSGGMGEVIEAEGAGRGRVVVKLLHRHLTAETDLVDRLRLEGEALGAVRHPNVVAALDAGVTADGRPYLVLERLEGRTLREELDARGPLPADEALDLVAQALDGLAAIHRAGFIHRDVKPDNLFVCDAAAGRGRVLKVLDLGVAKRGEGARPPALLVPTAEGVSMGTPRFFSPEQATGAPLDARADVYAAGLVLYALITGHTPFDHLRDVAAILRAHAAALPDPPSRHAPAPLPPALDAAVLKALEKRPGDRFAGAEDFAAELRRIAKAIRPWSLPRIFFSALLASLVVSMIATAIIRLALR